MRFLNVTAGSEGGFESKIWTEADDSRTSSKASLILIARGDGEGDLVGEGGVEESELIEGLERWPRDVFDGRRRSRLTEASWLSDMEAFQKYGGSRNE